jgi:hypothetical protein
MSKNTQLGNLVNGVYVDSSGLVGIGTQVPSTQLQINGTPSTDWGNLTLFDPRTQAANQGGMLAFAGYKTGTSAAAIFAQIKGNKENSTSGNEAGYLSFLTNNNTTYVERMRITSDGVVGIGITNPAVIGTNYGSLAISGSAGGGIRLLSGTTSRAEIYADSGAFSLQAGSGLSMNFYTSGEKMRITSGGNVLIGTTTDNGYKLNVSGSIYASSSIVSNGSMYAVGGLGSQGGIYIDYGYAYGMNSNTQNAANAWNFYVSSSFSNNIRFFYGGSGVGTGTAKAQIDTSGNYSALSDFNKKKDIALSTLGLAEVMQLKPSTFKFKDDENQIEQIGFIAQEVKDIIPQAYYEDAEGDDKFIGLKQTAFIPVLVKAIQELKAEIEILKQK